MIILDKEVDIKKHIIKLHRRFHAWYWGLTFHTRHIVGWSLILFCLIMLLTFGYGLYQGVIGVCQLGCSAWVMLIDGDEQEEEIDSKDDWSYKGLHRQFQLSEKNPKRNVNFGKDFNDINDVHLSAAQKLGISPLKSREDLEKVSYRLVEL